MSLNLKEGENDLHLHHIEFLGNCELGFRFLLILQHPSWKVSLCHPWITNLSEAGSAGAAAERDWTPPDTDWRGRPNRLGAIPMSRPEPVPLLKHSSLFPLSSLRKWNDYCCMWVEVALAPRAFGGEMKTKGMTQFPQISARSSLSGNYAYFLG